MPHMGISRQQKQIHKVMIVEDELDILLLYKDFLRSKGYSVIVSSTFADEILTDYEKYMPDIVIIDYKLPGRKNGLEATREILDKYSFTPILIVTAFESVKEELSKDEFFSDKKIQILIKPVKLARLAEAIQNINNEHNLKYTF
jgi:DNA-binding response OmpR family regulator